MSCPTLPNGRCDGRCAKRSASHARENHFPARVAVSLGLTNPLHVQTRLHQAHTRLPAARTASGKRGQTPGRIPKGRRRAPPEVTGAKAIGGTVTPPPAEMIVISAPAGKRPLPLPLPQLPALLLPL